MNAFNSIIPKFSLSSFFLIISMLGTEKVQLKLASQLITQLTNLDLRLILGH